MAASNWLRRNVLDEVIGGMRALSDRRMQSSKRHRRVKGANRNIPLSTRY